MMFRAQRGKRHLAKPVFMKLSLRYTLVGQMELEGQYLSEG